MKQLQKSDLKEGEIYVSNPSYSNSNPYEFLNKHSLSGRGYGLNLKSKNDFRSNWYLSYNNMREATPEEKHWLETCIKVDQFVSYEEAMKSFIPEYVECIKEDDDKYFYGKLGTIYKVSNWIHSPNDCMLEGTTSGSTNRKRFKPSTKEAYDTQFVVKDEFVLPDKWRIKLTFENQKTVIDYINKNTKDGERSGNIGMYYGYNGEHCTCIFNTLSNTEITFDQFKQYVLKENIIVTEKPKVVLEEPKDKVLTLSSNYVKESIVKVECSEGGIYRIGDKITVFTKNSPNKGKPFTIKNFRWSNDKSKICAVTELHTPNGIGLDKIELYVEPKVKFVLPEKWCVEVNPENQNFINSVRDRSCSFTFITSNLILPDVKNSWWCNMEAKSKGFTEITLEQFKKYVLKDE